VLVSIGAAWEARTVDELGQAVGASAVALVGADGAVVTPEASPDGEMAGGQDGFLPVGNQVAFSVPFGADQALCVAVYRKGRDFSAAELDRLDALRRLLVAGAVQFVHRDRLVPGTAAAAGAATDRLSFRESAVLSLVASGLGNDQIGRRLGISTRTVQKHLEHVYAKIGVTNRTQATARWLRAQHADAGGPGPTSGATPGPTSGPG